MKKQAKNYRIRKDVAELIAETAQQTGMSNTDVIEQCVIAQARSITKETCPDLTYLRDKKRSAGELGRSLKGKMGKELDPGKTHPDSN